MHGNGLDVFFKRRTVDAVTKERAAQTMTKDHHGLPRSHLLIDTLIGEEDGRGGGYVVRYIVGCVSRCVKVVCVDVLDDDEGSSWSP